MKTDPVRVIAAKPMRTVRARDLRNHYLNPAKELARLTQRGVVTKFGPGLYAVPPLGVDGMTWAPALEDAALAAATVKFGDRVPVLMGVGAARHWGAYPRALRQTTVAIPEGLIRKPIEVAGGQVLFVPRNLDRLDVQLEATEFGKAKVATPAQTLYDLLMGRYPDAAKAAAREAIVALEAQVPVQAFEGVIRRNNGRANDAVRETLGRLTRRGELT